MEYLIPAVLVLILVGGFVTFLVLNATKKSGPVADREDEGAPGMGRDETPLGDTTEHAGEQSEQGTTVGGQDADASGGSGRPVHSGSAGSSATGEDPSAADPDAAAHLARPGEGEGHAQLDFEGHRPPAGEAAPDATAAREAAPGEPAAGDRPGAEAAPEAEETERPASERLADRGV
jgi:hypothetical protein